jgi:hypothetical protein
MHLVRRTMHTYHLQCEVGFHVYVITADGARRCHRQTRHSTHLARYITSEIVHVLRCGACNRPDSEWYATRRKLPADGVKHIHARFNPRNSWWGGIGIADLLCIRRLRGSTEDAMASAHTGLSYQYSYSTVDPRRAIVDTNDAVLETTT